MSTAINRTIDIQILSLNIDSLPTSSFTQTDRDIDIQVQGHELDVDANDANSVSEISVVIGQMIKGDKGDKGDKGKQGDIGPKGEDGQPGIDGKDGKDGLNGIDGQDGISATIQVGSVTGGTIASVVNSGTQRDAVFDFVLPKGDAGIGFQSVTSQQDGTIDILLTNNDVITVDLNHTHPNYYKKTAETSQPSGGFSPDVEYNLGTLTGNVTFALASAVSGNVNHYFWTFSTSSSNQPTITWPTGITWVDGSAPTISANSYYEISVLNGYAMYLKSTIPTPS